MEQSNLSYDAIVIGSGIGGITAAGLLARVSGKKVLVLEKHTEPGGLTHVFRRDGASWDVGLHYVGEVGPGTQGRAFFDYLSGGKLSWNRMPHLFERFMYPDIDISVPSDPSEYERMLSELFPQEKRALRCYFIDIRSTELWTRLGFIRGMVPKQIEPLLRMAQKFTSGLATQTTGDYLAARFHTPELRAILATQWGDYGLPPDRSAFAIHAQIVSHYLKGAWFPDGGAGRIARSFEKGIERVGGAIRVAQEATEIIIEGGRAVGVKVLDRRGSFPEEKIYRAPIVISNVGAFTTFERLLSTQGESGILTAPMRALIRRLGTGLSAVTLYLKLKADARTLGVQGENLWVNTTFDHNDIDTHTQELLQGKPRRIFVSFPSIKAGENRFHTAEIISFVEEEAFARWCNSPKGNRGADYSLLKQRISDGLLKLADTAIPDLSTLVIHSELSTPLTIQHYTSHPGGRFYGLPATPERYHSVLLGPRTPIKGLCLSGSDAGCPGILGAMMGGVSAACQSLGPRGFLMINTAVRKGKTHSFPDLLPADKKRAVLVSKRAVTPSIWRLEFKIEGNVEGFVPGQFARLRVAENEWRDYSIADLDRQIVRLLISTSTGGDGSLFVHSVLIGATTEIELPLGQYRLSESGRRQVFVATGTGLAPFLSMFRALQAEGCLADAVLFFGCKTQSEDITAELALLPAHIIRCSSHKAAPEYFHGRVIDALTRFEFAPDATDFYLCGSSMMVEECRSSLEERGAKYIFTESF